MPKLFSKLRLALDAACGAVSARPIGHKDKVQSFEQVARTAAAWRAKGYTVGFTNGCYDLLHSGHIFSIAQTRHYCDRLVIGVNSDASVSVLKGPNRPVHNEQTRALVLASLADVDAVVIFGEDTPYRLIEAVQPDILVKGKDYEGKPVVGRDIVEARGGKVILADMIDGVSTTATIARMNSQS